MGPDSWANSSPPGYVGSTERRDDLNLEPQSQLRRSHRQPAAWLQSQSGQEEGVKPRGRYSPSLADTELRFWGGGPQARTEMGLGIEKPLV